MYGESYDVWGGSSFLIPGLPASPDSRCPCFYQNLPVERFKNISVSMSTSKISVSLVWVELVHQYFFKSPFLSQDSNANSGSRKAVKEFVSRGDL